MAGIGCLVDLLLFYTLERVLFNRMVCSMGKNSQQVKKVIALWLMLEEIGYHDLIRTINSYGNTTIEALFYEALQCLVCIQPNSVQPFEPDETPLLIGLFDEPMNLRFFYYNRGFMYKRYMHIMETVCEKIFGETKALEVDESSLKPAISPFGEGSSTGHEGTAIYAAGTSSGASGQAIGETSRQSSLNPDATEFFPGQTPEDSRTMFLTFSMGHPLSRHEIIDFFTTNWGDVIQDVFIERILPGKDPQFGRIVFTSSLVIPRILNAQTKAKFMVNRKHLWARIYVPRHRGLQRLTLRLVMEEIVAYNRNQQSPPLSKSPCFDIVNQFRNVLPDPSSAEMQGQASRGWITTGIGLLLDLKELVTMNGKKSRGSYCIKQHYNSGDWDHEFSQPKLQKFSSIQLLGYLCVLADITPDCRSKKQLQHTQ
ncbi:unnamed protein product [Dovyalis caffra]|uniref:RRM domain-containing protein n=1 Tax=Dovyalis caffra TaxID=77055 RepID=A0AAV1ST29_9ROSI|nr:unnamed protein product [Dovyalis caffra]